jgi:hypothetical protein
MATDWQWPQHDRQREASNDVIATTVSQDRCPVSGRISDRRPVAGRLGW